MTLPSLDAVPMLAGQKDLFFRVLQKFFDQQS